MEDETTVARDIQRTVKAMGYDVSVIAYSGHQTVERAKVTEPFVYLLKPLDKRKLRTTFEIALYKHNF